MHQAVLRWTKLDFSSAFHHVRTKPVVFSTAFRDPTPNLRLSAFTDTRCWLQAVDVWLPSDRLQADTLATSTTNLPFPFGFGMVTIVPTFFFCGQGHAGCLMVGPTLLEVACSMHALHVKPWMHVIHICVIS